MAQTLYGLYKRKGKPKTAKKFFYRWKKVKEEGLDEAPKPGERFRGHKQPGLRKGWHLDGGGNPVPDNPDVYDDDYDDANDCCRGS